MHALDYPDFTNRHSSVLHLLRPPVEGHECSGGESCARHRSIMGLPIVKGETSRIISTDFNAYFEFP